MHAKNSIVALSLLTLWITGCAGTETPRPDVDSTIQEVVVAEPPSLTVQQRIDNLASFEKVWKTVQEQHWDPELGGVDWEAVRDELRPQVEEANTMGEVRGVLTEMLGRLGQSHFGVVPGEVYDDVRPEDEAEDHDHSAGEVATTSSSGGSGSTAEKPKKKRRKLDGNGDLGMDVRVLGAKAVVTSVAPGSAADRAGVAAGWEIVEVDGRDIAKQIERVGKNYDNEKMLDMVQMQALQARVGGRVGDEVDLVFRDGKDELREMAIALGKPRGKKTTLGNMPAAYVTFGRKFLEESNVGYITFSMFMDPQRISTQFGEAVTEYMDADGIVIDLRGNPGGIGGMAMGMAGWFIDEQQLKLGTMHTRTTQIKFVVFPRAQTFRGPVAILTDGCSASTSEIYAQGMKDLERARIFGTRTCGAALPSIFERLPNGDGFQYAIADYISEAGVRLEGTGVVPDTEVRLTREALLEGRDPVLEAAVEWIRQQTQS